MQRPNDINRPKSQQLQPSTNASITPAMMNSSGYSFSLDDYSRGLAAYPPFSNNNLAFHVQALNGIAQFPPQRLQVPVHNGSLALNTTLRTLSEMAKVNGNKRAVNDSYGGGLHDAKRQRKVAQPIPSATSVSPMLMQRLSSMTGGFPMPKWGGGGSGTKKLLVTVMDQRHKRPTKNQKRCVVVEDRFLCRRFRTESQKQCQNYVYAPTGTCGMIQILIYGKKF